MNTEQNAIEQARTTPPTMAINNSEIPYTSFSRQPIALRCTGYICNDQGVLTQNMFGHTMVVCVHPILPIMRLINGNTGEESLVIAYRKGDKWRTILSSKKDIATSTSIVNLANAGVVVNAENARILSTYLLYMENLNYDILPEQHSASQLGWTDKGEFLPYVENITFDGDQAFKHIFDSVQCVGNEDAWLDMARKVRAEKTIARVLLAASFASVLLEPCGLLPFFIHAWGQTEKGKTVMLMLATSVWANPASGAYITTFNSTNVGLELYASCLNSLPMCIDELQLLNSTALSIKGFDNLIYSLTEGIGRTRGSKQGGVQKLNTWRNCFISTGETPLQQNNSGGGAVNRLIEIECDGALYSDLHGLSECVKSNYGFAGKKFIEFITANNGLTACRQIQQMYYRQLQEQGVTDKQASSASVILTADKIATECIFADNNCLTISDIVPMLKQKTAVDTNLRMYFYIKEWAIRNQLKFQANGFDEYANECWGRYDRKGYLCILRSVFDQEMAKNGFNSTAFLSWAKRRHLLDYVEGRNTKQTLVNGRQATCVCLFVDTNEKMEEKLLKGDAIPWKMIQGEE